MTRALRFAVSRLALALGCIAAIACTDQTGGATPSGPVLPSDDAGTEASTASEGGVSRRPGVIRVATFNVRRFFDTVCDSSKCQSGDFEEAPSQASFDTKVDALAKGIALLDPDVIALEEVETSRCLDALIAKLASLGKEFPIANLGEIGGFGSIDVAILARGSLTEIKKHRNTPIKQADGSTTTFSRELLEVRMTFGATAVVMFAAHFRSQVSDDPARRLAEAKATQTIMTSTATELPNALVLLGGDLNDRPGSAAIDALEAGGALLRVAKDIPVDDQGTYIFNGVKNAIDHIFVASGQATRYLAKSTTAYRDDPRGGFASSDHAALAADFSVE